MNAKDVNILAKARAVTSSLFYFIFTLLFAQGAYGEKIHPIVQAAYGDVLDLNFSAARDKLKFVNSDPLNNPYSLYVANLNDVLEIYVSDRTDLFDLYKSAENIRLKLLDGLPDDKPEKYFLEAEIKIHWAFANFKFGNYLKAFWGFRQAYSTAREGQELFPDFLPLSKTLGVLHTVLGSFPDNYSWLLSLMNAEGDISKGMEELNKLNAHNSVFWIEASAYKSLFQTYLLNEKAQAATGIGNVLESKDIPDIYKVVAVLVYFKASHSKEGERVLLQLEKKDILEKIPYLQYIAGEINLQKEDYVNAIQYYLNFIHDNKGENYIKDAYLKVAICHWLAQDSNYSFYLAKAKSEGRSQIDVDKNANQMANSEKLPNRSLLKIRYATDGGYFGKADSLLKSADMPSFEAPEEILEYHYRLARYYHLTDQPDTALKEYKWVIDHQENSELYFAPNACLQSGYIFVINKDYQKAAEFFTQALDYKKHPYEASIDKKAGIELERLEPMLEN